MNKHPLLLCPITKLETLDSIIQTEYYEYSIKYDGTLYELRLTLDHDWKRRDSILESYMLVLEAMLCNNEWPLEKETIITPNLIDRIIRFVQFPKTFDQKLNHYLLRCFKNGGSEYRSVSVDRSKYVAAYCENEEHFDGVLHGLKAKQLVEFESRIDDDYPMLRLTEEGINKAKRLDSESSDSFEFPDNLPEMTIVSTVKDVFYYQKLKQILESAKIKVHSYRDVRQNTVSQIKPIIYSEKNGYTIFIKSKNSDDSRPFGTIVGMAIESHQNTEKIEFDYLYFAAVDDSDIDTWPRVRDYHKYFYDFRIIPCRDQLLRALIVDWTKRHQNNTPKYNFPQFDIDESERLWLQIIYQKFLNGEKFDARVLFTSMWKEFPIEFDPKNIDSLLISHNSEITLFGISVVDPKSEIFELFEKTIFAIREILQTNSNIKEVKSKDINLILNVPDADLFRIFWLIRSTRFFSTGSSSNDNNYEFSLHIDDDKVYNHYRSFKGLDSFIDQHIVHVDQIEKDVLIEEGFNEDSQENTINENENVSSINETIDPDKIDSFKTKISIRDHEVNPVMGVTELAYDMAEIIDALPIEVEKGQMIGIFGKWGRGKTFLLREIWKVLSGKKADENLVYTKVEYHAWKYQETPASWAYLYENFVDVYLSSKKGFCNRLKYYYKLYKLNYRRNGIWSIIKFTLPLISSVFVTVCLPLILKWVYALPLISIFLTFSIPVIKKFSNVFSTKAIDLIKLYGNRHSYKNSLGLQAEIQKELIDLLEVWIPGSSLGKKKIILFVEDIDRCTEERIIENVDALRILLEDEAISKRVIIITAIDERILKNAIRLKYDTVISHPENNTDINELISEYLDKLFISAVKLGGLTENQRSEYVRELLEKESDPNSLEQYDRDFEINKRREAFENNGIPNEISQDIANQSIEFDRLFGFEDESKLLAQVGENKFRPNIDNGDFVIEGGDISMVNESGITMNQVKQSINNRIEKQNQFEKLSQVEIGLILNAIEKWGDATPRQIRIFYYRYLLCKNLIINKYYSNKVVNIWQNKEGIETLIKWILKYTDHKNTDTVSEQKRNIAYSNENYILFNDVCDRTIKKEDCLIVHEILELVIAY